MVLLLRPKIVKRRDDQRGFVVLPRLWMVERTFSWFAQSASRLRLRGTLVTFFTLVSTQMAHSLSLGRRLSSAIHREEGQQIGL